jgi:hypothetical protein
MDDKFILKKELYEKELYKLESIIETEHGYDFIHTYHPSENYERWADRFGELFYNTKNRKNELRSQWEQ